MMEKITLNLSVKEKIGYSLGDTASHFVWDMVGFWLLFFYTDVYGISAAAAGTIMLVARFWDAGIDPVIGILSDRTNTRWGKFRPYILFGAIPYAVIAVLAFSTPHLGETGKIVYAVATYVLLMTAYASVNLPFSALGAVMTDDTYERAGLNTYRFIAGFTGQFIVSGLALTLVSFLGKGNQAQGFQYTVMLFAGLSLVFFFITFQTTKERVKPPKAQQNSIKEDFGNLFKNKAWVILAIVGIVSFVMFAMQNAAIAYYFKYYLGSEGNEPFSKAWTLLKEGQLLDKIKTLNSEGNLYNTFQHLLNDVQLFNILGTIALIVALPLSKPLAKRFGNKNVFIASSLISGLFFMLIYLPGVTDLTTIYVFNIIAKMAYAPAVPLLWTMIADSADYGEWTTGRRATGLYFSAAVFAQKAGWGIGAAIAGWILAASGFVANIVQNDTAITGIKLLVSVIPGILYMSCAIFMIFYKIDAKTTTLMKQELDARRAKENE
jgi:GPH family glycoside/pentoside/hexuronide:cation symporter